MQSILHILKSTGISQDLLAAYAGLSRQNLKKASTGFINLDTATVIKLSTLQHTIANAALSEKQGPFLNNETVYDGEQEMTLRYRAMVLQRKLNYYETAQKKYLLFLGVLESFQPNDEQERLWVQRAKSFIIKKLDTCGVATCMRLRKTIYLLEAEADYVGKFANNQNPKYEKP